MNGQDRQAKARRNRLWIGLSLLGCVAALVAVHFLRAAPSEELPPGVRPVDFRVVLVDDEVKWASNVEEDLPDGALYQREMLPAREGDKLEVTYLVATIPASEGKQRGLTRMREWLVKNAPLPTGRRHELQWTAEPSGEGGEIRSFVGMGAPILTSADVEEAQPRWDEATSSWGVQVALTKRGAAALREATQQHLQRRIAIVFDGVVAVAPLVVSPLELGHVLISLEPGVSEAEAKLLAAGMGSRLVTAGPASPP
jgi:hypothetical protein